MWEPFKFLFKKPEEQKKAEYLWNDARSTFNALRQDGEKAWVFGK